MTDSSADSSNLRALYQEVIIDHGRRPRNFGPLPEANHNATGYNPLCGDKVTLHLKVKDDVIDDVRFEGAGCAISMASASMMSEALKGHTVADANALFARFHALFEEQAPAPDAASLGKLEALTGVREFPSRVKCATLAWHTLTAALADGQQPVSTE